MLNTLLTSDARSVDVDLDFLAAKKVAMMCGSPPRAHVNAVVAIASYLDFPPMEGSRDTSASASRLPLLALSVLKSLAWTMEDDVRVSEWQQQQRQPREAPPHQQRQQHATPLLAYFTDDDAAAFRAAVLRILDAGEDEALRCAALELVHTAVESQAGLARLLLLDEASSSVSEALLRLMEQSGELLVEKGLPFE